MRKNGDIIEFTTAEQDLGLPATIHAGAAINIINELEERRDKVYNAACQPSPPGAEAESRSAAFNYATDLGMTARRLMQVADLGDLEFIEE